jgi:hypothetical protein
MFRPDDIADDHKALALASLFEDREKAVTGARRTEERQSPVAGTSDKVQVMSAVSAMQSAGHNKPMVPAASIPALAQNARTGHPVFRNGTGKASGKGGPPAPPPPPPACATDKDNPCQ